MAYGEKLKKDYLEYFNKSKKNKSTQTFGQFIAKRIAAKKRRKEVMGTHLSRQSKRQLQGLGKNDYQEVMRVLKGKKKGQ